MPWWMIAALLPSTLFARRDPAPWRLRYVELHVAVEPVAREIRGAAFLTFSRTRGSAPLVLDLDDSMQVDSARVTAPSGATTRGDQGPGALSFAVAAATSTGTYHAAIWYHGRPLRRAVGFTGGPPANRAASFGLPYSAREWWPVLDEPAQKADSADVWITAPAPLQGVSIGRLVARRSDHGGSATTSHWATRYPVYPDAISFAAADYSVSRSTLRIGGRALSVEFYLFPEDSAKGAADFAHVGDILTFYADRLGPYPFPGEKYALVEFARPSFREAQTLSHLGAALITGTRANEQVVAHEIAHQWFGNSLTVTSWQDIWLNESLAEYMAWQWIRHAQGEAAYRTLVDSGAVAPTTRPIVPADPTDLRTLFGNATFQRGPAVLVMLEREMGTKAFQSALRHYVAGHAHGQVVTEDFQHDCEVAAGKSLADFFGRWVRGNAPVTVPG